MKQIALFIILGGLLSSFCLTDNHTLFSKLEGVWVMKESGLEIFEEWKSLQSNKLSGKSYIIDIDHTDTIILETISIEDIDNEWFYITTVGDQNDGKAVRFKLISSANDLYIFENKLHDFPQRINYQFIGNDSIAASIEGEVKGEVQKVYFNFKRKK